MRPVGEDRGAVLGSVQEQRGFERFMDYIFYQVAAINGFDSFGHYLRAGLIVNQCSTYAADAGAGLLGELPGRRARAAPPRRAPGEPARPGARGHRARRSRRALRGRDRPADADEDRREERRRVTVTPSPDAAPRLQATPSPPARARRRRRDARAVPDADRHADADARRPPSDRHEPLLDYLFGKDE